MDCWMHRIGLPLVDWPRFNGYLIFRAAVGGGVDVDARAVFAVSDVFRLTAGWIAHSLTGVVFALVLVIAIHPNLPWRNSALGNLGKALVWGLVLANRQCPVVGSRALPRVPPRLPSWDVTRAIAPAYAAWQGPAAIFVWHLIWGLNLGLIYNSVPADELEALESA